MFLQRIHAANAGAQLNGRHAQRFAANRRARQRQNCIDSGRAQERAFTGHVRAADQQHAGLRIELHVVAHALRCRNQRMPELFAEENRRLCSEFLSKYPGTDRPDARRNSSRAKAALPFPPAISTHARNLPPNCLRHASAANAHCTVYSTAIPAGGRAILARVNPINDVRQPVARTAMRSGRRSSVPLANSCKRGDSEWFAFEASQNVCE